VHNLSRGS
jgi:hypothetical protein